MKRPAKKTVLEALRPEVRFNAGSSRLIEAVELRSGILVAEYMYVQVFSTDRGYRYQRKVCIKPWWDRPPLTHTVESGYTDTYPGKEST